ncbi:MAG: hypothetical protein QHD01_02900 [Bradyrhizobium sp.]|uniref:hypothetical protein n=1 Tax=Bradyrhizobium sp. TaxID=376 RepID=UPI0029B69371|nr:hypothetical protein [Bradyrhizobium sp.]MDX3965533.1 hypothetical protein [Bradyrhizobium sp.]
MTQEQTFTAYLPADDIEKDDLVIARGVSAVEAMKIAFGFRGRWGTHLAEDVYGPFVLYTWSAYPKASNVARGRAEPLCATVARGGQPEQEKAAGLHMIAAQFLRRQTYYWDGRVVTDAEYDKRVERVAERREVRRIDGEIATMLVDAFIAEGYTITCDLQEDEPEFVRSTDRNGILDYMRQVEWVELNVHKGKSRGWLRLIFDENGFDLVQDYTIDLEHIVEPICEPYRRAADRTDSGDGLASVGFRGHSLKNQGILKW